MATTTTNYAFSEPTVGANPNDWGGLLNANWEKLDQLLFGDLPLLGDLKMSGTGFIQAPSGTTAQRPSSPIEGYSRYNSDTACQESYANGEWRSFNNSEVRYSVRNTTNAAKLVAALAVGESGWLDDQLYMRQTAAGALSVTNDLGVDNLVPATVQAHIKHFGVGISALGAATDQTAKLQTAIDWVETSGAHVLTSGEYKKGSYAVGVIGELRIKAITFFNGRLVYEALDTTATVAVNGGARVYNHAFNSETVTDWLGSGILIDGTSNSGITSYPIIDGYTFIGKDQGSGVRSGTAVKLDGTSNTRITRAIVRNALAIRAHTVIRFVRGTTTGAYMSSNTFHFESIYDFVHCVEGDATGAGEHTYNHFYLDSVQPNTSLLNYLSFVRGPFSSCTFVHTLWDWSRNTIPRVATIYAAGDQNYFEGTLCQKDVLDFGTRPSVFKSFSTNDLSPCDGFVNPNRYGGEQSNFLTFIDRRNSGASITSSVSPDSGTLSNTIRDAANTVSTWNSETSLTIDIALGVTVASLITFGFTSSAPPDEAEFFYSEDGTTYNSLDKVAGSGVTGFFSKTFQSGSMTHLRVVLTNDVARELKITKMFANFKGSNVCAFAPTHDPSFTGTLETEALEVAGSYYRNRSKHSVNGTAQVLNGNFKDRYVVTKNPGATTVTAPAGMSEGFSVPIMQEDVGTVTVVPASGVTIQSLGGLTSCAGQYGVLWLHSDGNNKYYLYGDLA